MKIDSSYLSLTQNIPLSKYYEVGKVTREKLPCDLALQVFKFIANSSDTLNIVWKILSIQFISKNTFGLCNKQYIKLFACQVNNQFSYYTKVRRKAGVTIPTINSAKKTLIAVDAILITLRLSLLRTHTIERIRPSRTKAILPQPKQFGFRLTEKSAGATGQGLSAQDAHNERSYTY